MNIAEFFVKLGIKGSDQTKKSLESVDSSLKNMGSNALMAKAGILGAMWGLERMMSSQMNAGAGMVNFAATTGLSIQRLQEWKWAAQQVNVAGSDVEGSLKGIQGTMMNMLQGGGAPKGMAMFADYLAQMGEPLDDTKLRDMDYMMDRLQKFAQSGPADLMKDMVGSFGINENVFGAMRRNAFTPEVMSKAPKYSDGAAKSLDNMKAQFANIGTTIEMGMGQLFAKHGPQFVRDIGIIIPKVMELVSALAKLSEKARIFEVIGLIFDGWAQILDAAGEGAGNFTKAMDKKGIMGAVSERSGAVAEEYGRLAKGFMGMIKEAIVPETQSFKANNNAGPSSLSVVNNNTFSHTNDPKKIGSEIAKQTKKAAQTSPAQRRNN